MSKPRKQRVPRIFPYDQLPDSIKAIETPESWEAGILKIRAREAAEKAARLARKPVDHKEPVVTLAQADADPRSKQLAETMRLLGVTEISRSTYMRLAYGSEKPRGWDAE